MTILTSQHILNMEASNRERLSYYFNTSCEVLWIIKGSSLYEKFDLYTRELIDKSLDSIIIVDNSFKDIDLPTSHV